jgi:hypothetical protein
MDGGAAVTAFHPLQHLEAFTQSDGQQGPFHCYLGPQSWPHNLNEDTALVFLLGLRIGQTQYKRETGFEEVLNREVKK